VDITPTDRRERAHGLKLGLGMGTRRRSLRPQSFAPIGVGEKKQRPRSKKRGGVSRDEQEIPSQGSECVTASAILRESRWRDRSRGHKGGRRARRRCAWRRRAHYGQRPAAPAKQPIESGAHTAFAELAGTPSGDERNGDYDQDCGQYDLAKMAHYGACGSVGSNSAVRFRGYHPGRPAARGAKDAGAAGTSSKSSRSKS
jgi:hypothetical protein